MAFGLYLHYPFVSHQSVTKGPALIPHDRSLEQRFYAALQLEAELAADAQRSHAHHIESIYVGGGDAAITDLRLFEEWYQLIAGLFMIKKPYEFSFSIDPQSCRREFMQALIKLGVNRPVFGVPTFSEELLKTLGRVYTLHQVHEAIYYANALGFDNYSCELRYGLPGQTGKMLSVDLDQITDLDPPHISFREFRVSLGSEMVAMIKSGDIKMPGHDFVQTLYQAGCEHLTECGYEEYLPGSFAKPGHECRYDLDRSNGGDFLGLGPSARSLMNGQRSSNVVGLDAYLDALERGHRPLVL